MSWENNVRKVVPYTPGEQPKVKDIVYQGVYTKYWLQSGSLQVSAIKPHSRFLLDQETITWNDEVFVWWHPDDGYMVEVK